MKMADAGDLPKQWRSKTRCTRFVCISDTHNCTVKLPKGDVLIHAGDLTNQGTYSELSKAVKWLEKADFEAKIVIAGNHDITLDSQFYADYGLYFHNQRPESSTDCISLMKSSPSITYLSHSSATVRLSKPGGPHTKFTVFGSPYSPRNGLWAFGYRRSHEAAAAATPSSSDQPVPQQHRRNHRPAEPAETEGPDAAMLWSAIPLSADVVVTHTPPRNHCDEDVSHRRSMGCEALRRALWRVRPRLAVCGHVHEGRGAERVRWDIGGGEGSAHARFAEEAVLRWEDPSGATATPGGGGASGKMALVDLTGDTRLGRAALDNDGKCGGGGGAGPAAHGRNEEISSSDSRLPLACCSVCSSSSFSSYDTCSTCGTCIQCACACEEDAASTDPGRGVLGMGGDPAATSSSARCDRAALLGRMGRRETCVVNCAIMANSYPHVGGKKFNKPIVVDLDLPVWDEAEERKVVR